MGVFRWRAHTRKCNYGATTFAPTGNDSHRRAFDLHDSNFLEHSQTTQELLAALRASQLAAGAGGAQDFGFGGWGFAQGNGVDADDLPPNEQEREMIYQIREAGFWDLTEVASLLTCALVYHLVGGGEYVQRVARVR
jgi:hypothetical protein